MGIFLLKGFSSKILVVKFTSIFFRKCLLVKSTKKKRICTQKNLVVEFRLINMTHIIRPTCLEGRKFDLFLVLLNTHVSGQAY